MKMLGQVLQPKLFVLKEKGKTFWVSAEETKIKIDIEHEKEKVIWFSLKEYIFYNG